MILAFLNLAGHELMLILVITFIPFLVLINILKSRFEPSHKLMWASIVIFTNIFGAALYFMIGRNQKVKKGGYGGY